AEHTAARALTALRRGRVVTGRLDGALYAQRISTPASAEHGEQQPVASRGGRTPFPALARFDNREELGAALGVPRAQLARTADAILILRMIERWGDAGVARCLGAFVFALW